MTVAKLRDDAKWEASAIAGRGGSVGIEAQPASAPSSIVFKVYRQGLEVIAIRKSVPGSTVLIDVRESLVNSKAYRVVHLMALFSQPPMTQRERSKLDRRQAIVDTASASFLADGYSGTSMSGLLKTLGGSKATLWSYFRCKEDLFAAVVEDVSRSFRAEIIQVLSVGPDADPEVVLTSFCGAFMHKITSDEALATWRLVVAESGRFPEVGRIFFERSAGHTHAALVDYLVPVIAAGRLRDENVNKMAEMLISLCVGFQTHLLWGGEPASPQALQSEAAAFARWFMRAFGPAAAPTDSD